MRWLFTVSLLALAGGCGDPAADDHPDVIASGPVITSEPQEVAGDDVAVGPCKHDERRECKQTLKVRNGITTCARGEQRCEAGRWSECRRKEKDEGAAGAAGKESQ